MASIPAKGHACTRHQPGRAVVSASNGVEADAEGVRESGDSSTVSSATESDAAMDDLSLTWN
jgi:hypothetical protein